MICNDADYFLRHRRIVADRLAVEGWEVSVVTGGRKIGAERGAWSCRHIPIERFRFHPVADLRLALTAMREAVGRRLDVLHLITLKPAVVGGLAAVLARTLTGYPRRVVITVAGLGRLMGAGGPGGAGPRRMVERAVGFLGRRDYVAFTFETEHDRDRWLDKGLIRRERSLVTRGAGVDPLAFHPRQGPREPGRLRVLFASRLLRAKGLDAFLLAAEALAPSGEFEFLVAGMADKGDPDGYEPDLLRENPAIRFLGAVADMPGLLRSVDVVCLASRYGEGIPRILIEAAACGVPMVASGLEGCREVVVDGETGFVVTTNSPEETALAIGEALQRYRGDPSLHQRHAAAARRHFLRDDFSEEAVVGQFLGVIDPEGRTAQPLRSRD